MTALAPAPVVDPSRAGPGHASERWSLDRLVSRSWLELAAGGATVCPVCEGEMTPGGAAARCRSCGSELE